jgi:hypothetical protein
MIGMGMGVDHPVEPPDAGVEQLLAQVGRGVDQDAGLPALVEALHQHEQRRRVLRGSRGRNRPNARRGAARRRRTRSRGW